MGVFRIRNMRLEKRGMGGWVTPKAKGRPFCCGRPFVSVYLVSGAGLFGGVNPFFFNRSLISCIALDS